MANFKDYPYNYSTGNEYRTTPEKRKFSPLGKSLSYYLRLLGVLIKSNIKVRRKIYHRYNWTSSSFDVLHALESVGAQVHVTGLDNFKNLDRPIIFIGNHMSTAETMLLPGFIQPVTNVIYIIKQELTKYPLFGPIAAARHPILVGRENPREDLQIVMTEGAKKIEEGRSIIIFPQKTRTKFFDSKSFNSLGIKLAKRNDCYVVPVALVTDCWGNGPIVKDVGKIDTSKEINIAFGEPFKVEGNGTEEHNRVIDFIKAHLAKWNREELIVQ